MFNYNVRELVLKFKREGRKQKDIPILIFILFCLERLNHKMAAVHFFDR